MLIKAVTPTRQEGNEANQFMRSIRQQGQESIQVNKVIRPKSRIGVTKVLARRDVELGLRLKS